jgi:hypothetical protein
MMEPLHALTTGADADDLQAIHPQHGSGGSVIFAFGSNDERPPNRLVYIAQVTEPVKRGEYFERFRDRQDAIYQRAANGELVLRRDARTHNDGDHRPTDVGKPPRYAKANAFLCEDFRYFGRKGTDDWKHDAPTLTRLVEGLGQGHRVNFTPALMNELTALKDLVWRRHPHTTILGKPLHTVDHARHEPDDTVVSICKRRCEYHHTKAAQPRKPDC